MSALTNNSVLALSFFFLLLLLLLLVEVVVLLSPGKVMGLVWSGTQFHLGEEPRPIPR